jgi:hypothetical protein
VFSCEGLKESTRSKCDDNIKMGFKEIRLEGVDWINLAQDRHQWWALANTAIHPLLPYVLGKLLTREELLASKEELRSRG